MGTPPAAPPPDVEGFKENKEGEKPKTVREIMEQHRSKPSCNQCHGVIDPIGLALENYDAIGRWRDVDSVAEAPINANTVLPNGRPVDGPAQLRQQLSLPNVTASLDVKSFHRRADFRHDGGLLQRKQNSLGCDCALQGGFFNARYLDGDNWLFLALIFGATGEQ